MDRELASAVLGRWESGDPVYEGTLYKAASVLGLNPDLALLEARYYTSLDNYLLEKRAMDEDELIFFTLAAGHDPRVLEKTASSHSVDPSEVTLRLLQSRNWIPDLEKLANVGMQPGVLPPVRPGGAPAGTIPALPPPVPGAQVQQIPEVRTQPTPTAPPQVPPSPEGNINELLAQGQMAQRGMGMGPGGQASAGMGEPPPPPPAPEDKIMQVAPHLDQETVARYSEKLIELEQATGMPINDPKQMVKFVQGMQKVDSKKIDAGIKQMVEEESAAVEQDISANSPTPTVKPHPVNGGASNAAAQQAAEKVAGAARLLACLNFEKDASVIVDKIQALRSIYKGKRPHKTDKGGRRLDNAVADAIASLRRAP